MSLKQRRSHTSLIETINDRSPCFLSNCIVNKYSSASYQSSAHPLSLSVQVYLIKDEVNSVRENCFCSLFPSNACFNFFMQKLL